MTAFDKLPQEKVNDINKTIKTIVSRHSGMYFKKLYDPRQTHAVYGVTEGTMDQLKSELKNVGANKFRKVKANGHNLWILCFSVENVK